MLCCSPEEEQKVIETFDKKKLSRTFLSPSLMGISRKTSLTALVYFDIKDRLCTAEFEAKMTAFQDKLSDLSSNRMHWSRRLKSK